MRNETRRTNKETGTTRESNKEGERCRKPTKRKVAQKDKHKQARGVPRCVMVKAMECRIVESEFVHQ